MQGLRSFTRGAVSSLEEITTAAPLAELPSLPVQATLCPSSNCQKDKSFSLLFGTKLLWSSDGAVEGAALGAEEGVVDGSVLGPAEGCTEGPLEGALEGCVDGSVDGEAEGSNCVGRGVAAVGVGVGTAVP